ncbi:hypothetical protein K474DRAFT_1678967 [Panus rudis PR-1116 ss-1]|nr:hypothetical protein K474DRAFT_1678967 [Panus rudis PR-1116 ss-1]
MSSPSSFHHHSQHLLLDSDDVELQPSSSPSPFRVTPATLPSRASPKAENAAASLTFFAWSMLSSPKTPSGAAQSLHETVSRLKLDPCDTYRWIPPRSLVEYAGTHNWLSEVFCLCQLLHGVIRNVRIFTPQTPSIDITKLWNIQNASHILRNYPSKYPLIGQDPKAVMTLETIIGNLLPELISGHLVYMWRLYPVDVVCNKEYDHLLSTKRIQGLPIPDEDFQEDIL